LCDECGLELEDSYVPPEKRLGCPRCGSIKRDIRAFLTEPYVVVGGASMELSRPGEKRPFLEQKGGYDLHRKSGKWNKRSRTIDRDGEAQKPTGVSISSRPTKPLSTARSIEVTSRLY
jgi:hypothetical protein